MTRRAVENLKGTAADAAISKDRRDKSIPIEGVTEVGDSEASVATVVSRTTRTLDDALKVAKVDLATWAVDTYTVNKWDTVAADGKGGMVACELWQVKVWLKRRKEKWLYDAMLEVAERFRKYKPPAPKPPKRLGDHLAEISIFDAHFGKLCWGEETGTDYDTKIAERIYENAVADLLARIQGYRVERFLLPIGNDFFHVDNWQNTTANGTPQDHDGRFQKVFRAGVTAIIRAIEACLHVAPVHVLWVPGNHDRATSWYLCECLSHRFQGTSAVEVDTSPKERKYVSYGNSLIGFTHGDRQKLTDLPLTMATEVPELWAAADVREIHVGHWHHKKELRTIDVDEKQGVRVRILPSLSAVDAYHYKHLFVSSRRCAEVYLFGKLDGYVGHFSVSARE